MKLLELRNVPIKEQLAMEEAILRLSDDDVCVLNYGSPRAIVMGISGDPDELLYMDKVKEHQIPVIRRYSGGGTVIIDENTLFVSFIFQKTSHPFSPFPEKIMQWSTDFYKAALQIPTFSFRENDYVIGERKMGGNAQYIQRTKWLHHTSFLYDFSPQNMDYLQMPKKTPSYRSGRSHTDFLTILKPLFPSKEAFFHQLKNYLSTLYPLESLSIKEIDSLLEKPHRKATLFICQ